MAHSLIIGITESGKTSLAKLIAKGLKKKGIRVAVLDPLVDPGWQADFITDDPDHFLDYVKKNRKLVLFVDESGTSVGRYNPPMEWLATTSRHLGHSCFFICHRLPQLPVNIRTNCTRLYMFACCQSDANTFSDEWNEPTLSEGNKLEQGEFFIVSRFSALKRGRLSFPSMKLTIQHV